MKKFQFHSFVHSCPVFPTPFTEETVFSALYNLASLVFLRLVNHRTGFISENTELRVFIGIHSWYNKALPKFHRAYKFREIQAA